MFVNWSHQELIHVNHVFKLFMSPVEKSMVKKAGVVQYFVITV